jgi:DNA mismatch repair protein MutL
MAIERAASEGLASATDGGAIRPLTPVVVNQIAAGEVVERPASVVKELIDNALDAGATRVSVELERGGIELIRVTDDGCGIVAGDLPMAAQPHATSKIRTTSDLDAIATMGFRGEAIASIASVSRVELRSRAASAEHAAVIMVDGGASGEVRPASGPVGTRVTVRNLFFNTPARRKFLKAEQTERGHCQEVVRNLAMAHPAVGFELVSEGRTLLDVALGQSPRERVLRVLGAELEEQLVECHADRFDDARGLALWGMLGTPELARPTAKRQHVFLNGRPIRDRTIQHALREAYRGLIEPGRHPLAVVMLEMSPSGVDVNVHPAKAEVRFRDQSLVHRVVHHAAREALAGRDLTPGSGPAGGWRFELQSGSGSGGVGATPRLGFGDGGRAKDGAGGRDGGGGGGSAPPAALGFTPREDARMNGTVAHGAGGAGVEEVLGARDERGEASAGDGWASPAGAADDPFAGVVDGDGLDKETRARIAGDLERLRRLFDGERERIEVERRELAEQRALIERARAELEAKGLSTEHLRPSRVRDAAGQGSLPAASPTGSVLRVHNSFLITQDERGLVIIDQHALHERVMFEMLKRRLEERGAMESQRLLMPTVVKLDAGKVALLESMSALFETLGIDAAAMGDDAVAVHAFPTFLSERNVEAAEFLAELLERAEGDGLAPNAEDALHEVLDMMACKAAVKAGDTLSPAEVDELLRIRAETERSGSCPHGRPTQIRLTLDELERQFGR